MIWVWPSSESEISRERLAMVSVICLVRWPSVSVISRVRWLTISLKWPDFSSSAISSTLARAAKLGIVLVERGDELVALVADDAVEGLQAGVDDHRDLVEAGVELG